MGDRRVADEGLVGGVEEDEGLVRVRVVHERRELLARGGGAGGVVGEAEVEQVDLAFGRGGDEAVGLVALEVDEAGVAAVGGGASAAGHDVGVHVDRIDGVGHADGEAAGGEEFLEVAGVALGAVADEDLVRLDVGAAGLEVGLGDGLAQEVVAELGAVAAEGGVGAHFADGLLHGLDAGGREGASHVADAQANEAGVGMGGGELADARGDRREQVRGLDLGEMGVGEDHGVGVLGV